MELNELQRRVDEWIRTYGVRYFGELTNMAVLTEEVGELARCMRIPPSLVAEVMGCFLVCDPCMKYNDPSSGLYPECLAVWRKYISKEPEELAATAAQMRAYFR